MRWLAPLLLVLAPAGVDVEDALEARWRGAWAVTRIETFSTPGGFYTNNVVSGTAVASKGARRFAPGEIAKVDGVELGRNRVGLKLALRTPVLVPRTEGPFTLYEEEACRVELLVDVPDENLEAIDAVLAKVLERHPQPEEAEKSGSWNGRKREPYPPDYDRTVAAHAAWKSEQRNAALRARMDQALAEAVRITDRISSDPVFLDGFARGVERMRGEPLKDCTHLFPGDFEDFETGPPVERRTDTRENRTWRLGYREGQRLVFELAILRVLPACLVPVPK